MNLLAWEVYAEFFYPLYCITLLNAGFEVEASAAKASADVLPPLVIFVSSNLSTAE